VELKLSMFMIIKFLFLLRKKAYKVASYKTCSACNKHYFHKITSLVKKAEICAFLSLKNLSGFILKICVVEKVSISSVLFSSVAFSSLFSFIISSSIIFSFARPLCVLLSLTVILWSKFWIGAKTSSATLFQVNLESADSKAFFAHFQGCMRIVQKIDYIVGKRVRIFVVLYYNAVDIVFEYISAFPPRSVVIMGRPAAIAS